ncbi:Ubiquitin-like modifier-activating enzyme ATG7 [Dissostichus eleginoides]|uniref:Ubiquitin-like modifier-activating enzyme ATG7 n=1 Tax=Dissostichus eleginoides TaxID=100907 RepID=A0AAD9ES81_DISEL|nr:Ubiquitin-like modifier-activating enzyme ATG7 [Dissostichus eleginoides]
MKTLLLASALFAGLFVSLAQINIYAWVSHPSDYQSQPHFPKEPRGREHRLHIEPHRADRRLLCHCNVHFSWIHQSSRRCTKLLQPLQPAVSERAHDFMEMTNEWACLGYGLATCKA